MNPALLPKVRSDDLRKSATQMPCTLRIGTFIGLPCAGQDTNVMCHLPVHGKGTKTKVSDLHMACGCLTCHSLLDGADARGLMIRERYPRAFYERLFLANAETISWWVEMGLLNGTDWNVI